MTFFNSDLSYDSLPGAWQKIARVRDRVLQTMVNDGFSITSTSPVDNRTQLRHVVTLERRALDGPTSAIVAIDSIDHTLSTSIRVHVTP